MSGTIKQRDRYAIANANRKITYTRFLPLISQIRASWLPFLLYLRHSLPILLIDDTSKAGEVTLLDHGISGRTNAVGVAKRVGNEVGTGMVVPNNGTSISTALIPSGLLYTSANPAKFLKLQLTTPEARSAK